MIRGTKQITPKKLNYDINFSIHNRFDVEVIDSRTGEIRQKAQAHNVICNGLWECLCSTTAGRYYNRIGYGSGSGTPSVNDTKLFHQEGYKELPYMYDGSYQHTSMAPKYSWDWDTGVVSQTIMIALPETELVGVTLTEVGIISAANNKLSTHAMLKDMNGNEISIEKTATDIINIYSTIFIHFNPQGYSNGGILMYFHHLSYKDMVYNPGMPEKTSYLYTILSFLFGFFTPKKIVSSGGMVFCHRNRINNNRSFSASDGNFYCEVGTTLQTSLEEKTITISANRLAADKGNGAYDGISTICFIGYEGSGSSRSLYIQVKENSWYSYTQITGESVATGDGETKDFALKFPKAHDVKVYVDGVESQVTTEYIPHNLGIDYLTPIFEIFPDGTFMPGLMVYNSFSASTAVFYNPWYQSYGISGINKISGQGGSGVDFVKVSNDLLDWTTVNLTLKKNVYQIPEEYQNYKYWDFSGHAVSVDSRIAQLLNFSGGFTGKAVHFETPPAAGSVITADYKTDTIAKDENHVFDFSLTIHLGEYSGA